MGSWILVTVIAQAVQHLAVLAGQPVEHFRFSQACLLPGFIQTGPEGINPSGFDFGQGVAELSLFGKTAAAVFSS